MNNDIKDLVETIYLNSISTDNINTNKTTVYTGLKNGKQLSINGISDEDYIDITYELNKHKFQPLIDYIDNYGISLIPTKLLDEIYDKDYYEIYTTEELINKTPNLFDIEEELSYNCNSDNIINFDDILLEGVSSQMEKLGIKPKIKVNENVNVVSAIDVANFIKTTYGPFIQTCNVLHKNNLSKDKAIQVNLLDSFVSSPLLIVSSTKKISNKHNLSNLDILDIEMMNRGYYRIRTSPRDNFYMSIYNPVKDESVNEQLRTSNISYIYHLSPVELRDKIKSEGIVPSIGDRRYLYKDKRSFFNTIYIKDDQYLKMMKNIYILNNSEFKLNSCGEYDIWEIRLFNIPSNIIFYADLNAKDSVFIKDILKPQYLQLYKSIDLNLPIDEIKRNL